MIKKFERKYGVTMVLILICTFCVCFGYCVGHSEAIAEVTHQKETIAPVMPEGVTTITREITAQPEYIELTVTATAYCACEKCCGKTDGITATGTKATAGRTIAVDPSVIPYGTEVIINGHTYVAEDCGGAIKGNSIDIYFDSHAEALEFGRQNLVVKVKG